jgi:Xaa-Pro aminopeptidase
LTEFEQRRRDVAQRLASHKVDAVLVTSLANVRYLSGYAGSNGLVLIGPGQQHFFTDPRYGLEAQATITASVHVVKGPLIAAAAKIVKRKKWKKIGIESETLTVADHARLKDALPLGFSCVSLGRMIEERRMVKSASEIEMVRRSVLLNSEAFARTMRRVKTGTRENEIAAELEFQMRALGAEKPSFETIVAMGERSALPHSIPTARAWSANELLLIDMGASLHGYASDMTRMAYTGVARGRVREVYRAVLEAQLAAVDAVRPGVTGGKVDAVARGVLKKHKLDAAFVHSTGHGLGLEIHEPPRMGKKDKTPLAAGMTITVEPGAYFGEWGGIRIEDTVLVTSNGYEVLTPTPKELLTV